MKVLVSSLACHHLIPVDIVSKPYHTQDRSQKAAGIVAVRRRMILHPKKGEKVENFQDHLLWR
jgi:hypothetical protein